MVTQISLENLMGPKLDQEPSTSSISVVLLTNKQTNGHESNISLLEVIIVVNYPQLLLQGVIILFLIDQ